MKKNKMMRLASWLLVLTLLTTCIISGTFAKYVTGDEGEDIARVAKWGVTATVSGSLFGEHYNPGDFSTEQHPNQFSASYTGSVDSVNEETDPIVGQSGNIVAPGTEAGMEPFTISVSGTPEVAVKVELDVNAQESKNFSDIWLAEGSYGVMSNVTKTTKADNFNGLYVKDGETYTLAASYNEGTQYYKLIDTVTVNDDTYIWEEDSPRLVDGKYYPIIWKLTTYQVADNGPTSVNENGGFNTVADLRDELIETSEYDSLTNLSSIKGFGSKMISWEWPYAVGEENEETGEYEDNAIVDGCDTILGNLMAYGENSNYQVVQINEGTYTGVIKRDDNGVIYASADGEDIACLTVGFNASVTVTQVD